MARYLLIDLEVNRVPLSLAANHRRGFMEILLCDWLTPRVGQDWRRGRLVDILKWTVKVKILCEPTEGFTNFQELELHIRSSHVLNGLPYGYPLYRKNPLNPDLLMSQSKSALLPPRKEKVRSFLILKSIRNWAQKIVNYASVSYRPPRVRSRYNSTSHFDKKSKQLICCWPQSTFKTC